jgi:uncharacterized protein (TIGR00297 family)
VSRAAGCGSRRSSARSRFARIGAGLAVAGAVSAAGWRAGALTSDGAVASSVVGAAVLRAGGRFVPAMLAFFGLSSALSRLGGKRKRTLMDVAAKGERRDAAQVLANGGVSALLALGAGIGFDTLPAYRGALAAVAADTWSTELGALSRRPPRSIVSGAVVLPGTSGGVTLLGIAGGLAGGAVVGSLAPAGDLTRATRSGALAGLAGTLVDSLLGATLQRVSWCPSCDKETERLVHTCGTTTVYRRGLGWLDNDLVNLAAALVGALVGWALD